MANAMIIKWMKRSDMLKRGARMMEAYHRGKINENDLDRWFISRVSRYVRYSWKWNEQPTNLHRMKKRFWLDAEKHMIVHSYGWQLSEFK